jgi:hypothetical protein
MHHVITSIYSDVNTLPLHVSQKAGERRPGDDVGTVIRTSAVPDGSNLRDICGDLYAAAVVHAQAGLPPDGLRQVCH